VTEKPELIVVVPAIIALRTYIDQNFHGSIAAFARENKLDPADIGKIVKGLRGRGQKITVAYADKIEKATNGRVNIRMWLPVVRRVS